MREKFIALEADVNSVLVERQAEVHTAVLAILSRRHHFQLGSPGVAKSMLVEEIVSRIDGLGESGLFKWLLTKFTLPEELFGGPDFLLFKENGIYKRVTDKKLPSAYFAFLDETFKGSSSILNSLLKIANERQFDNYDADPNVPLISLFGASNEGPQSNELDALADRFTIWHKVEPISDMSQFIKMLSANLDEERDPVTVSLDDIYTAHALVSQVAIPDEVLEVLWELRQNLAENDIMVTDRRFHQSLAIIQAEAFMNGRDVAQVVDTKPLQHVMWRDVAQIDFVRKAVLDLADPLEKDALQLLSDMESLFDHFVSATKDSTNSSQKMNIAVEAWGKLKNIKTEINDLRTREQSLGRSCKTIDTLVDRKKQIAKVLLEGVGVSPEIMESE